MVAEDPQVQYPDLKPNYLNGLVQVANAATESPYSAISGTTARTSRSNDLRGSSAFDLLDAFPGLSDSADKVLSWLLPVDDISEEAIVSVCNELHNGNSRTTKNVLREGQIFDLQKNVYGRQPFIDVFAVLSTLLGSSEAHGNGNESWRPEPVLHKANITALTVFVTRPWEVVSTARLVEELDQIFPAAFTGRSSDAEDFTLALEIRTQHFILQLIRYIHEINFDPDMLLSQVFQNNPTTFKGWNSAGLRADELSEDQTQAITRRFHELGQNFADGKNVAPDVLRNAYPWLSFVAKTVNWSRARLGEIDSQINMQGGVDAVSTALNEEIHGRISAGMIGMDGLRTDIQLEYPSPSQISSAAADKIEAHRIATIKAASRRSEKLRSASNRMLWLFKFTCAD